MSRSTSSPHAREPNAHILVVAAQTMSRKCVIVILRSSAASAHPRVDAPPTGRLSRPSAHALRHLVRRAAHPATMVACAFRQYPAGACPAAFRHPSTYNLYCGTEPRSTAVHQEQLSQRPNSSVHRGHGHIVCVCDIFCVGCLSSGLAMNAVRAVRLIFFLIQDGGIRVGWSAADGSADVLTQYSACQLLPSHVRPYLFDRGDRTLGI